jgi:UDP-N-acetyl-2-amino-2-deoxyglucuronate dehydrogenase
MNDAGKMKKSYNFALIGAAGFAAPRHIQAIFETRNRLIAAADPHDSVGVLDRYFQDVRYFPEIERFDRHLEKLKRAGDDARAHYISICSPNYLHDAHVRLALRLGAHAICEKPLVIKPWNLDYLQLLEEESETRVFTVLQLRRHKRLIALKQSLDANGSSERHRARLTYVSPRGPWYDVSWKGIEERSGGVAMNIGVHFFDLLLWLFGAPDKIEVHLREKRRAAGFLSLKNAEVEWFLSVDASDSVDAAKAGPSAPRMIRSLALDGERIDFSEGFENLHTAVYERILSGDGFGIEDARPSVTLVHKIREAPVSKPSGGFHPSLERYMSRI